MTPKCFIKRLSIIYKNKEIKTDEIFDKEEME